MCSDRLCRTLTSSSASEAFQKQQLAVKVIACYSGLGYILTMALLWGFWCTPIYEYWAVPVRICMFAPSALQESNTVFVLTGSTAQCATYYHHMMFATAWNISSDLMLLCVPIPIIARSQLPLKRKIILCAVLGLGILNVIIAVLNRYYNFNNPDDLGYVYFYVAEVATAVFVGNIPLCWPLFRRIVQGSDWSRDGSQGNTDPNQPRTRTARATGSSRFRRKHPSAHSSMWTITRGGNTQWDKMDDVEGVDSNKENIYRNELGAVAEDQSSTMELTPGWHHQANHTTIQASRTRSSDSDSTEENLDKSQVKIIDTVEITSAAETIRHSRGNGAPRAV